MISAVSQTKFPSFRLSTSAFPSPRVQVITARPRDVSNTTIRKSMAGTIRQPIDVASLSTYLEKNLPDIRLPIGLKQVHPRELPGGELLTDLCLSLALVNQIPPTSSAQPMEGTMYYERSRQASCSPRPHIRSNASSASSMPYRVQMYPSPKLTGCARTQR